MREFQIHSNEAGQRLDKYLKKLLCNAPDSFVYKMMRKKNIVLNGKKTVGAEQLREGDRVTLFMSDETFHKFSGDERSLSEYQTLRQLSARLGKDVPKLPVIYEDLDVIIINKPAGMLSQKARESDFSANEYILAYLIGQDVLTEEMMRTFKPSVCNRLDRNTSGLLIAGKTLKGLQEMSNTLRMRTAKKYYRCIVRGEIKEGTYVKGWLWKDSKTNRVTVSESRPDGQQKERAIETEYRPVFAKNGYTELEVHLITGRSHQIRAHLAYLGHPIVGDEKYGDRRVNEQFRRNFGVSSQLLHAYRMEFKDGRTVTAPYPAEFDRIRNALTASCSH